MGPEKDDERIYKMQFKGFITLLYNSAMQQMGKIMSPLTGKIEKNLEGAKATIDMIKMLQVKTKGNLSKEEETVLSNSLANLQMNYIDELDRESKEKAKKSEEKTETKEETKKKEKKEKS